MPNDDERTAGQGTTDRRLIAYYRVSTARQGESGLGLEGQMAAVERHAEMSRAAIVGSYREVESGKDSSRPALKAAIDQARRDGATLVIAKLDRLSRNVHFISGLMESQVDFIACDNPNANRLTVHLLAAIAEWERDQISERTKAALAAYRARREQGLDQSKMTSALKRPYKARNWALGGEIPECRNLRPPARVKGNAVSAGVRKMLAEKHLVEILPIAERMRREGASLLAIADHLNAEGFRTRRGNPWGARHVLRILDRAAVADAVKERELASARLAREEAKERRETAAKARWEALQARRAGLTGDDPSPQ